MSKKRVSDKEQATISEPNDSPMTILCISSYEKGHEFLRECKRQGCRVIFLTSKSLENVAWPKESIDEIYFVPDNNKEWNLSEVIKGVSYLARKEKFDKVVALDDFDVEKAAAIREHLRIPGMGETTSRYFRDKLSMRMKAREEGINVPDFVHVLNHNDIHEYTQKVQPPYILKPRSQAGAIGMKKLESVEQLWEVVNGLGDDQPYYLIESFVKGDIYHVDSIIDNKEVVFANASKYALPPMEVAHQGRVFSTRTLKPGTKEEKELIKLNAEIIKALGLKHGVSHTEFIKDETGKLYFLETSARVGGANIVELVEAARGINLWSEWSKLETTPKGVKYKLPKLKKNHSALLNSLAKQEWPNLDGFNDDEVFWKLYKPYHAGVIITSPDYDRISELLENYTERFYNDFFTYHPPVTKAVN